MAERQTSNPRRSGGSSDRERRQAPSRRNDVIRCENCGEDYSITYKRCPFCDERPVKGGIAGKRVANTRGGGYGRPASNLRVAGWVVSFAVILCAAAIVVRFMGLPILGGGKTPSDSSTGSQSGAGSTSQTDSSGNGGQSGDSVNQQPVESVVLSALEATLDNGKAYQLTASLLPTGAVGEVAWASSDISLATVDETGLVTNVSTRTAQADVTIVAQCGDFTAKCVVHCNPASGGSTGGSAGGGAYVSGTARQGVIVGADTGLNIRSGPGRDYDVVASGSNGAEVTVLGEENGWYQIRYSGTSTGYVSKEFVSLK